MNVVIGIPRVIDNFPIWRPRKNTIFNDIKVFRWNNINGERVVSVSKSFNVSVGKKRTDYFSQKGFSDSGKTRFAASFSVTKAQNFWLGCAAKESKVVLSEETLREKGVFWVRIVRIVFSGILRITDKIFFGGIIGKCLDAFQCVWK